MLDQDINQLVDCYTQILKPKRALKPIKNPLIIALDTEFDNEGLISLCLSYLRPPTPLIYTQLIYSEKTSITINDLLEMILSFCRTFQIPISKTIYLISHFAQAELQHIENLWKSLQIRVFHKSMYADFKSENVKLKIIDTYAHFLCGLDKVARSIGMEKVSLDGVGNRSENYWKANMRELLRLSPETFEKYAKQDSEILIKAFNQRREFFLKQFGLDILRNVTLAQTSQQVFTSTKQFLNEDVEPSKFEWVSFSRNTKKGWKIEWKRTWVYDGSRDKRYFAMKCYWGGRREAFIRGLIDKQTEIWDVKQMYPTMAKLPLPNQYTEWCYIDKLEDLKDSIGFINCHFKFPENIDYPCLPIFYSRFPKLVFPLEGETWCSTYEVDLALRLGCQISNVKAWVFYPSENERNHPLKQYMEYFTKLKNENQEGSMPYETSKLLMNALIGKFCQRDPEYSVETYQNILESLSYDFEQFREIMKHVESRQKFKNPINVGSCWNPEWSSLILGSSRAIISEIMHTSKALTGHTDSVIIEKGSKTNCEAISILHRLGSDLEHKAQYDSDKFWICRSAVYTPIKHGIPIKPTHHGYPCDSDMDFGKIITENLTSGKSVLNETRKTHLTTPKEALRQQKRLSSQTIKTTKITWEWDNKRRLLNPQINIWKEYSETKPWTQVGIFEQLG